MPKPRVVFAGTPEFALRALEALTVAGYEPVAVLTQPDRPAGRGKRLTASPVKIYAAARGIPVLQPQTLRDDKAVAEIEALAPDVLIVAAYGLILPQRVLDIPRHGCINVHASALPRWRGAAPIQAAILAGDAATGVSLMAMTAGLDCGPVYAIEPIPIGRDETAGALHDRMATAGGDLLVQKLDDILAGRLEPVPQDDALATYAPKIDKDDARLDWSLPAAELARRVRAYNPFPGAFFFVDDVRVKCWGASPVDGEPGTPGRVVQCDRGGVVVACGTGRLSLDTLQLPGKRRVSAAEFAGQLDLSDRQLR